MAATITGVRPSSRSGGAQSAMITFWIRWNVSIECSARCSMGESSATAISVRPAANDALPGWHVLSAALHDDGDHGVVHREHDQRDHPLDIDVDSPRMKHRVKCRRPRRAAAIQAAARLPPELGDHRLAHQHRDEQEHRDHVHRAAPKADRVDLEELGVEQPDHHQPAQEHPHQPADAHRRHLGAPRRRHAEGQRHDEEHHAEERHGDARHHRLGAARHLLSS